MRGPRIGRRGRAGRPQPDRPATLLAVERGRDQRQARRHQHRAERRLEDACADEDLHRRRQPADDRRAAESGEADEEHSAPAVVVVERPGQDQQRGEHGEVGAVDVGQALEAADDGRRQLGADRLERHVHDRAVQEHDRRTDDGGDEDGRALAHRAMLAAALLAAVSSEGSPGHPARFLQACGGVVKALTSTTSPAFGAAPRSTRSPGARGSRSRPCPACIATPTLVAPATRERVQRAVAELDYRPSRLGRSLAQATTTPPASSSPTCPARTTRPSSSATRRHRRPRARACSSSPPMGAAPRPSRCSTSPTASTASCSSAARSTTRSSTRSTGAACPSSCWRAP